MRSPRRKPSCPESGRSTAWRRFRMASCLSTIWTSSCQSTRNGSSTRLWRKARGMNTIRSEALLSELSALVARHLGLDFPRERWGDLERGMPEIARAFGIHGIEALVRHLSFAPLTRREVELPASYLTVGETYFFRERRRFEALAEHVLPELPQARGGTGRHLRFWSAGCCTGEEPYSIAMLLDRLMPSREAWNITILATDINAAFLRTAEKGLYGEWL